MKTFHEIPVIDVSQLFEGTQHGLEIVAKDLKQAYTTVGFAYIEGHGIDPDLIHSTLELGEAFHALSFKKKMEIRQNNCFRGYVPPRSSQLNVSSLGAASKPNHLESFVMAFEVDETHPDYYQGIYLAGRNQWPANWPTFRAVLKAYRDEMLTLSIKLTRAFSVALGMDAYALDKYFVEPTYFLRLQHYPPNHDEAGDSFGLAPHTDYGFCSFVAQDHIEGLQIQHPINGWQTLPVRENSFVLNSGDMLKRLSNDTFRSTSHRVINKSGVSRYSTVFFYDPNRHANINVLASCIDDAHQPNYDEIKYGDYLLERIQANYGVGKSK